MRKKYNVYIIENQECGLAVCNKSYSVEYEFKDLDRGWSYMILFASFWTCCLVGANNYGTGIIHRILLERYKESVVLTSWSGSLQLALMGLSAPLSSAVIDKSSCRTSVVISGLLFLIGYWATAFAPNMYVAIFTCGVTAGFAAGLGYTASIVAVELNFKKRKNICLGVTLSGMGAGIFAFAPLMEMAHAHYGATGFFITMATLSANIITFGMLFFPSKLEIWTHKQRQKTANANTKAFARNLKMYYRAVIKKPILLLAVATFSFCGGTDFIFLTLPTIITLKGFTSKQAAFIVSLNGILSVFGRVFTGLVSSLKRVNEIWLYACCLCIVAIATTVYSLTSKILEGQIIYSSILGLFYGSGYVLISPICSRLVDIEFLSAAIGFVMFWGGIGSFAGPMIAGILLDNGSSYDQCLFLAGGAVLLASILGAITHCFKRHKRDAPNEFNPDIRLNSPS